MAPAKKRGPRFRKLTLPQIHVTDTKPKVNISVFEIDRFFTSVAQCSECCIKQRQVLRLVYFNLSSTTYSKYGKTNGDKLSIPTVIPAAIG